MLIRPGVPADISGVSRVYVESWRATYQDLAPPAFVDNVSEASASEIFVESLQSTAHSYFLHVVEEDGRAEAFSDASTPKAHASAGGLGTGRIVGFADGGKERSHPERGIGELYAIYLLKEVQGQGIGRALFEASRASLRQAGMDRMVVWVLEESPARKFYEAMGGKQGVGVKRLGLAGAALTLVPYDWGPPNGHD